MNRVPNIAGERPAVETTMADAHSVFAHYTLDADPPLPVHRLVLLEMRGERIGRLRNFNAEAAIKWRTDHE